MRFNRPILFLSLIGTSLISQAQVDSVQHYKNELSVTIDNDLFFFDDWYYTAGHELNYRRVAKPGTFFYKFFNTKSVPAKIVIGYSYGNKIFTPRETSVRAIERMDRPYAGWNYGGLSVTRLKGLSTISYYGVEVGLVGRISGMGQIQQWWHKQVRYPVPKGWNTQIRDEVVLNINYQFMKSVRIAREIDLISSSGIYGGTGLNKLNQSLTLRMMNFNSLTHSTLFHGRMGYEGDDDKEEVFLFIRYGIDYIISNIFLEGSLFDNPSPFIVEAKPWVFTRSFGIMHSRNRTSFVFEINNVSREIERGERHGYGRLVYAIRF